MRASIQAQDFCRIYNIIRNRTCTIVYVRHKGYIVDLSLGGTYNCVLKSVARVWGLKNVVRTTSARNSPQDLRTWISAKKCK